MTPAQQVEPFLRAVASLLNMRLQIRPHSLTLGGLFASVGRTVHKYQAKSKHGHECFEYCHWASPEGFRQKSIRHLPRG